MCRVDCVPFRQCVLYIRGMEQNSIGQKQHTTPVLLNYGGAPRFIAEMNEQELQHAREATLRRAKEKAFSKGLPIYYLLEGEAVAEYADGRIIAVAE